MTENCKPLRSALFDVKKIELIDLIALVGSKIFKHCASLTLEELESVNPALQGLRTRAQKIKVIRKNRATENDAETDA